MDKRHELVYKKNGIHATYGRLPHPLTEWEGIVYYVRTTFESASDDMKTVEEIINMLEGDSYNHGQEWRLNRRELIYYNPIFEERINLIGFRIKDMY